MKKLLALAAVPVLFAACGGGGGGGGYNPNPVTPVYGPYETVYGAACSATTPIPGCTFNRSNGTRVNVAQDPNYNRYGYQSDDLWFVVFDASGNGRVYDDLGNFQYTRSVTQMPGWVGGSTIGVGTTGVFWENVAGGTYWMGNNGVLYSANTGRNNFGEAINNKDASNASDSSFAALNSDSNKALVKAGAAKLVKEYGFSQEKAIAVASALNTWAVAGAERGFTTEKDMNKTFKSVFGVDYGSAVAAIKDFAITGEPTSMRELTSNSAAALGLKPAQAQKFMKGMYKKALANWGFDVESFNW